MTDLEILESDLDAIKDARAFLAAGISMHLKKAAPYLMAVGFTDEQIAGIAEAAETAFDDVIGGRECDNQRQIDEILDHRDQGEIMGLLRAFQRNLL